MADAKYSKVNLVAVHQPDYSTEDGPDGNKQSVELPGSVLIGVEVEGAFVPLTKIGKVRLDKKIANAKSSGGGGSGKSAASK